MINFIRERIGEIIIVLLIAGVIISFAVTVYYKENKIVGGVVIGHELVSNKYGDRTYITIIKTDDGYIEEKTGLNSYAIPENKRVTIEVCRWKK
jgi:uncharacterized membrane-anchored protein YitT (DUF2179 family)